MFREQETDRSSASGVTGSEVPEVRDWLETVQMVHLRCGGSSVQVITEMNCVQAPESPAVSYPENSRKRGEMCLIFADNQIGVLQSC